MEKSKLLTSVKYFLFLLAGLGITYYLFNSYYTPSFLNDLKSVNLKWLLISTLSAVLAHVFRAWRWQLMIKPITKNKIPFLNVFNALMFGYLVNLALPRAGELARCAWLTKKEKINTAELIGTVIAERVFDVLMLLVLVVCALFLYQDLFLNLLHVDSSLLFTERSAWIAFTFTIICVLFVAILIVLVKKKHPFINALKRISQKLWDGFISTKKIKNRLGFAILTLAIWFFYIASSYFAFKMLQQTELLNFSDAMLCVIAGSFGMIAPIQGGIGAFHFMVTKCLTLLGISNTPALVFATILHASQSLTVVLFGVFALISNVDSSKKKS